ncbi:flavodoxin [Gordonia sp. HY002]|uniref:flavodoxin domain-containing protein n=1 Tax=Gordonia zhenghanii TaxID=2911516 RepID=UPI001EF00725|nr:flavodoxin domain-containing protein [Gordonia zhenghanii]MCF8570226.1 flavodoxin [Gordonia zhenghanii]MCF8607073.1 flavodoxin [Gordonia zhenghanii]
MNSLIVVASKSHGNTLRIAEAMAETLDATVVAPGDVSDSEIDAADLVGWGSGVYWMSFAPELTARIERLAVRDRGRAFVFSTSGLPETPLRRYSRALSRSLTGRGFEVLDPVFSCRGLDTMGPLGLVGGVNKGTPTTNDVAAAQAYARRISQS